MSFACESVVVDWGKAGVSQSQILEGAADQLTPIKIGWIARLPLISVCYFVILLFCYFDPSK